MPKYPTNFRDLGGINTADSKTVRRGLLFRSGEPDELTEEEFAALVNLYDIRAIVDFRTTEEASVSKIAESAGVKRYIIDILKNAEEYVTSYKNFMEIKDPSRVLSFMNEVYTLIISDAHSQAGYREFLDIVSAQEQGALLFHCFAGKDRTGIAAAILLTILGVSKEDIFNDYLKTNEMRRESNKKLLEKDKKRGIDGDHLKVLEGFLLVDKRYLQTAFETAEKNYGSFDNYITQALKVTPEEREILKRRYLV